MGELGYEIQSVPFEYQRNQWAFDLVDVRAIKDRNLKGAGVKIAIIDNEPYPAHFSFFGPRGQDSKLGHGYPIAALIKSILPDTAVRVYNAGSAPSIAEAIRDATDRGFDVINISQRRPTIAKQWEKKENALRREINKHVFKGDNINDYTGTVAQHREFREKINESLVGLPFLDREIVRAQEKGVVFVAASGYPWIDRGELIEDTFGYYPDVIVTASIGENLQPIDYSPQNRVDLFAPAERIALPEGAGRRYYAHGNSFAAPYVAVACALTRSLLSKQSTDIREIVIGTAKKIGDIKVVHYGFLMKYIEGKMYHSSGA